MNIDKKQIIIPIILLLISSAIYFNLTSGYNFVQDDSYISFRYAENFVNGKGLVFNEGENVEGYTSLLWVMVLSLLKVFNLNLETWSQVLSFIFGLGVIVATYSISKRLIPSTNNSLVDSILFSIPSYLLAITGGFAYWAISGMETTLFILLLMLGFLFALSNNNHKANYAAVIFFVLASLTRPEGFYFITAYFFYRFFSHKKHNSSFNNALTKDFLIAFIPLLLFFLFRLAYYGYPLPNTFYAKAGISEFFLRRGWEYFASLAEANLLYGFLLILPILFLFNKTKYTAQIWSLLLSVGYILAIILIGGDVLPFHRLFLPVLPIIYILFIGSIFTVLSVMIRDFVRNVISFTLIILIFAMGYINLKNEQPKLNDIHATELGLVYKMKIYADWVKEQQKLSNEQMTVALSTIGAFSYYSNSIIIDLLGLTNEYIAHNPAEMKGISEPATRNWVERTYNAEYVLSQKPDYIIYPAGAKPSAFPESALYISPLFKELYYPQLLQTTELTELLTLYSLRSNNTENFVPVTETRCEENASVNFIEATNLFLRFSRTRDKSLIPKILDKADSALNLCPLNTDDILELKGMLYYYNGETAKSKHFFNEAIKIDSMNSPSYVYLINIYNKEDSVGKSYEYLRKLKKLSPYLYPQFQLN